MPKIILIQPTQYAAKSGKPFKQRRIYLPGLALPLLAAYAPDHWELEIIIELTDKIKFDEEADLIGIGAMGHAVFRAMDIAREFRRRGRIVFAGGYMVSLFPEFVKAHFDSVIIGDGDRAFPQILKDYEDKGSIKPLYKMPLKSLSGMPVPRYDLLAKKRTGPMMPVQAGRGCPHTCSFCSIACMYHGKYMTRPADEIMRDILHLKKMGYKRFFLIDDNIASNPNFMTELAGRIKPLNMQWASQCSLLIADNPKLLKIVAESGCNILSFGLESLSQSGLDALNKSWVRVDRIQTQLKKIRDAGILIATEMIVGTDGDTPQSLEKTAEFIISNKIQIPKFYILTPLPGTDFYEKMKRNGRLLHEDYIKYTATNCVFKPSGFEAQELEKAYMDLYRRVYSFKNILKRTIFNRSFSRNPLVHLFAFFTNIVYTKSLRRGEAPNIL